MNDHVLAGLGILVAEDEYLLAEDLRDVLSAAGASVIGPFPTVAEALACINSGARLDAAILDMNLRGEMIFPVAEALKARAIPFLFASGYQHDSVPARFAAAGHLEKPVAADKVSAALKDLVRGA